MSGTGVQRATRARDSVRVRTQAEDRWRFATLAAVTVVTAVADGTGARRIVPLATTRRFQPGSGFFSHLVLHFSIGEAY